MKLQLPSPIRASGTGVFMSVWNSLQSVLVVTSLYTMRSWMNSAPMSGDQTVWFQKEVTLPSKKRGCHLVTEDIERNVPELANIKVGLAHIHIKHTSASLALNENWDPNVRVDTEMMLNKIVPEGQNYLHSCEGPDDMPAHIKAALIGSSVTIPITSGKFNLGTWQGLWLCEHRNRADDSDSDGFKTREWVVLDIMTKIVKNMGLSVDNAKVHVLHWYGSRKVVVTLQGAKK